MTTIVIRKSLVTELPRAAAEDLPCDSTSTPTRDGTTPTSVFAWRFDAVSPRPIYYIIYIDISISFSLWLMSGRRYDRYCYFHMPIATSHPRYSNPIPQGPKFYSISRVIESISKTKAAGINILFQNTTHIPVWSETLGLHLPRCQDN